MFSRILAWLVDAKQPVERWDCNASSFNFPAVDYDTIVIFCPFNSTSSLLDKVNCCDGPTDCMSLLCSLSKNQFENFKVLERSAAFLSFEKKRNAANLQKSRFFNCFGKLALFLHTTRELHETWYTRSLVDFEHPQAKI